HCLEDGDRLLVARVAVARAEPLLQRPLELTRLLELLDDVRAAEQLPLDEHLRDRRPARLRGELLPDRRVGQDVDGRHRPARPSASSARRELPHITSCGVPFMNRATGSPSITCLILSLSSVALMRFLSS